MSIGLLRFSSYFVWYPARSVLDTMPSYPGAPAVKQWRLLDFWMQAEIPQELSCTYSGQVSQSLEAEAPTRILHAYLHALFAVRASGGSSPRQKHGPQLAVTSAQREGGAEQPSSHPRQPAVQPGGASGVSDAERMRSGHRHGAGENQGVSRPFSYTHVTSCMPAPCRSGSAHVVTWAWPPIISAAYDALVCGMSETFHQPVPVLAARNQLQAPALAVALLSFLPKHPPYTETRADAEHGERCGWEREPHQYWPHIVWHILQLGACDTDHPEARRRPSRQQPPMVRRL